MKISLRRKKSLVTISNRFRKSSTWVDNSQFWPKVFSNLNTTASLENNATQMLGSEQFLPGTLIAIGHKGLSFAAEIPAGYRTVEVMNMSKHKLRYDEDLKREAHRYQVYVPTTLVFVQFAATLRLSSVSTFFIKRDDLDFTHADYQAQTLYLTGFPNQYENGGICLPDDHFVAQRKSFTSMLNTVIEALYGSSFNNDMEEVPNGLWDGTALYDSDKHSKTKSALFKRWSRLTPEQVNSIKWRTPADHGLSVTFHSLLNAYKIPLRTDPFNQSRALNFSSEAERVISPLSS